uniref:EGF-like domain-containing protein n=1 Tax=Lutzomyia longipalpis TaxID=7200 RepID=A0A1B0GJQ2_LUTLO
MRAIMEINSTYPPNEDESINMEEDVLYQRGASFSAKLDDSNAHIFDNTLSNSKHVMSRMGEHRINAIAGSEEQLDGGGGGVATVSSELSDDIFYSKEDMSIYDDVNNNRLNLRSRDSTLYDRMTLGVASYELAAMNSSYITKDNLSLPQGNNGTEAAANVTRTPCVLDCGLDGRCNNDDGTPRCLCPFGKTGLKCEEVPYE